VDLNNRIQEFQNPLSHSFERHQPRKSTKTPQPILDHFRVSILTYGGIHTVEVFGPEIDDGHRMAPILPASLTLLNTLQQKAVEAEKQQGKVKP